jgi:hypothetical protein
LSADDVAEGAMPSSMHSWRTAHPIASPTVRAHLGAVPTVMMMLNSSNYATAIDRCWRSRPLHDLIRPHRSAARGFHPVSVRRNWSW